MVAILEIADEVYKISDDGFRIHSKINFMVIFTSSSPGHAISQALLNYKLDSGRFNTELLLPSIILLSGKPLS